MATASSPASRIQLHGHRGCRGLFPENTLPAFLHALQLGVDVLEMDVVLSADRQVVVAHEPWLSAQLGLSPTKQLIDPHYERQFNIYKMPYATVRQSVVGTLSHPIFPNQQLVATYRPLLTEVLQAVEVASQQAFRLPVGYSIELKSASETDGLFHPSPTEFVTTVLASIPIYLLSRITLLSFDVRILQTARRLNPFLRLCLLVELPFSSSNVFHSLGFIPNSFGPDYRLLTTRLCCELRDCYSGLSIIPWTVNEVADFSQLSSCMVSGITTDFPDRFFTLL